MHRVMGSLLVFLFIAALGEAQQKQFLFQALSVNRTHIAFSYAGDIWMVSRSGGEARRLTQQAGDNTDPVLSPDGTQIAFSRRAADNNVDVYVMPAAGGTSHRLTYHPKPDVAAGWSPDGKSILFASNRSSFTRSYRLYTVPAQGGAEIELPFPFAQSGSFSPNGSRIAYSPWVNNFSWRNYHGGWTSSIRIARIGDARIEEVVPHESSNDAYPMWSGNNLYFVSERGGTANLFLYELSTKTLRQLTNYEKYDIKAASLGEDAIAFTQDGRIYLYDLKTGRIRPVSVTLSGDFIGTKRKTVNAAPWIRGFDLSPSGTDVAFAARGEILIINVASGQVRNLTQTAGAAERSPVWSPDGKSIAYFSDQTGEYQLNIREVGGGSAARQIAIENNPSFYSEPVWSPDSKRIVFSDKRLTLWCFDLDDHEPRKIDASVYAGQGGFNPAWSPDGRWLAYSKTLPNRVRTIFMYSVDGGKSYQLTEGRQEADLPAFDHNGEYLYFISSHNTGPTKTFGISTIPSSPLVKTRVQAVVLSANARSPLLIKGISQAEDNHGGRIKVDLEGIGNRIVTLPLPARDYVGLAVGKPGILFVAEQLWTGALSRDDTQQVLRRFDLSSLKTEDFTNDVGAFTVSRDGSRILYQTGSTWAVTGTDSAPKAEEKGLDIDRLEVHVDPPEEWRQMYNEVWRIERDYFYDANLHGQNLESLKEHYAAYLPNVASRADLNRLFQEMLSHLSISHMAIGGGDQPRSGSPDVGLLGADYMIDHGRYRIERIYRGDPSHPLYPSLTSPLAQPGIGVKEGEYLVAVDGQDVRTDQNIHRYFEGKVGKTVELKIASGPGGAVRTVNIVPLADETILRRITWALDNRTKVAHLSGNRLAYIYLPDYLVTGFTTFTQEFYSQVDKQGVIIDQRFAPGGYSPDSIIETLKRVPLSAYTFREGEDTPFPVGTLPGPRVLITNEFNGSGADTFAWMWRRARLGTIVGGPTTGAGIGYYVNLPELSDGGTVSAPNRAFYSPEEGVWGIENHGVAPDVQVDWLPEDWRAGRDPQLARAIQIALDLLKKSPQTNPVRPKPPVYK